MNYIRHIASRIRAEVPTEVMPKAGDLDLLFDIYALLLLAKGNAVTGEDVHNAWAVWMSEQEPGHRSIQPFSNLSQDVQMQDEPFRRAIEQVHKELI